MTVTDANLLLGRLDAERFLGGRMTIDAGRSRDVAAALAAQLKIDPLALAEGVIRVANANMERAIRVVSVERGHDPRRFALLAFGGAGGMHACEIAQRLEIATVVVPRFAGVLSALGMLAADVTRDYSASVLERTSAISTSQLERRFHPLLAAARRELRAEGFTPARQSVARFVDVRYAGQSYEITVPFSARYRQTFDATHQRLYGYSNPERATEVVNVRVTATGRTAKPKLPFTKLKRSFAPKPIAKRPGRFGRRSVTVAYHRWEDLAPGAAAAGPAVITGGEATAVIPPGFRFRIDGFGNVIAER
jgi:N-methylhydantoinase A/oxoprolinase/acetone carboxylase beta subunit